MSDVGQYASFFKSGMKVGVGIPLPNAEVFRDWALIHGLDEDLVSLQLSRDQLPVDVSLYVGQIIEVRGGQEGAGYSCRAIIVSEMEQRKILLRLIGEIIYDELREFYRIDAFLPIKYHTSQEQNPEILMRDWSARREQRQIEELERKEKHWDTVLIIDDGEANQEKSTEIVDQNEDLDAWNTIIPLAANISGGGIRIFSPQGFEYGQYLLLEILIPAPQRIIDAVVKVVFTNLNNSASIDQDKYYNIAMQFVFIDERDRDAIIYHISHVQLQRIKQLREKYAIRSLEHEDEQDQRAVSAGVSRAQLIKRAVMMVAFAAVLGLFFSYLKNYVEYHPKSEIEETFEGGIRRYLERITR
ncbi:MAG TPA: PilZ-like domain-containing protein [Desulfuromonadaceae bacterium]|jgi:hypothetical protein